MESWLRSRFEVVAGGWLRDDGATEDAFAFTSATGSRVLAPVRWFIETFGSVPIPPTATALKAVDPDDSLGWHQHIDAWVSQGIVQP